MGICEKCGFVSGRKKIDINPCKNCGFLNCDNEKNKEIKVNELK